MAETQTASERAIERAIERDDLAWDIMRWMLIPPQATYWGEVVVKEITAYLVLTAAAGEVVMGPGDWWRATVQGRLDGVR